MKFISGFLVFVAVIGLYAIFTGSSNLVNWLLVGACVYGAYYFYKKHLDIEEEENEERRKKANNRALTIFFFLVVGFGAMSMLFKVVTYEPKPSKYMPVDGSNERNMRMYDELQRQQEGNFNK